MPGSKTSRRRRAGSKTRRSGSKTRRRRTSGSKARVGSKRQVYNGTAIRTSGGLTRSDLMKNVRGKIVSRRKHAMGQRMKKYLR